MSRVFNFSAGPAALPAEVLEQLRDEMLDWHGQGMSVMEMSHRGKAFMGVAEQAEADLRELLAVPSSYKVLFLQGGATAQFAAIPYNLTKHDSVADYVNTGAWSKKAISEAKRYCRVNVAADAGGNYSTVPPLDSWKLTPGAAYVHYTPNETIGGVLSIESLAACSRQWKAEGVIGSARSSRSSRTITSVSPAGPMFFCAPP